MESEAETADRRNDVLSQSYTQGVGRVAQQNNDVGFSFELPKEVLEKREKVWDNLFHKYTGEASDDIELNINTMEPVATEEDEDEEEENDDEEPGEYYSKCRAPMRKLPALIQYWIDTGNPPYQLVGDDDHSETGSSLSEGEHSRTGHSDVLRESSDKHRPEDTSPYSSVDTAAYILSNTNVTKKSETMAIVEGARKPDDSQIAALSSQSNCVVAQKTMEIGKKNVSLATPERDAKAISNLTQNSPAPPSARKSISESEVRALTTPLKNPMLDDLFSSPTGSPSHLLPSHLSPSHLSPSHLSPSHLSPSQRSVKLSEVLPTFRQFDELPDESHIMRPPATRSSLSRVRRKPKFVVSSPNDAAPTASQSSQTSSILPNGLTKPQNRRKLYTGRNSPVDLIIESTSVESVQPTGCCLHPALEPETTGKQKISNFASRARARRKRKRASQGAELVGQEGNTSQDSVTPITAEKSKGDMRYTDFFESLGLTPSKTIIGETPIRKPLAKRRKKTEKCVKPGKPKKKVQLSDAIDSSIKETGDTSQQTEDSVFSPPGGKSSTDDAASKLPVDKTLVVSVNRLSDNFLARYKRRDASGERTKNGETAVVEHARDDAIASSTSSSGNKKGKASINENIELLTTATHDSDSSTILICACNNDNNEQSSDSDNSLFAKNISKIKKKSSVVEKVPSTRSLRSGEHNLLVKINDETTRYFEKGARVSQKPKVNKEIDDSLNTTREKLAVEKSSKLPKVFIRLEKLDMQNLPKFTRTVNGSRKSRESDKITNNNNNNQNASKFSSIAKIPPRNGSSLAFRGFSPGGGSSEARNKLVTIGSRAANDFIELPAKPQQRRDTTDRCSLGISIPSDEEEDSFVKLVKEFGSEGRTVKIGTDETKKISDDELVTDTTNGDARVAIAKSQMRTRLRSNFGISVSSDEEDVSTKPAKKGQSKRRGTKTERNVGNEVGQRKKKIVSRSLPTELTNGEEGVKLDNRLDESNRRKSANFEATDKNVEAEVKGRDGVRRSARKKKSPSGESGERLTNRQSLPAKPKHMRNLFANLNESNSEDDEEALPSWNNQKRESTDEKSGANAASQSNESNGQETLRAKVTRSGLYAKSSVGSGLNSVRFQTRLDSDSDTDFETRRFSINAKNDRRSDRVREGATETPEPNCTEESEQPRRSFQKLIERRIQLKERILKHGKDSVENAPKASDKDSIPAKNGATKVTSPSRNRLSSRNESAKSDASGKTKDSSGKQKNTKITIVQQKKQTPQNISSRLSARRLTSSPPANQPNSERFSPIASKKPRRTRLLPVEYESDDDAKLIESKTDSGKTLERTTVIFPNGMSSRKLSDEQGSSKKRRDVSKNLFYESPEEDVEGIDFILGGDTKSPAKECAVVIDSLNFVSGSKHKNLNKLRQSTISFRTKLRLDSDDDDDDNVS